MRQFTTLFGYEMKKILCRKSTWVCLAVIIVFYVLSEILIWGTSATYTSNMLSSQGQITEEGAYTETYAQAVARQRRDGLSWSGRSLDDALMQKVAQEVEMLNSPDITVQQFNEAIDHYRLVCYSLAAVTGEEGDDPYCFLDHMSQQSQEKIYGERRNQLTRVWGKYMLTEKEISYWKKKEETLVEPFTLQYSGGFDNLVTTQGIYMALLLVCFFIAVTVSEVFAQEHTRKTDQLILSSRLGRKQIYYAKMLTGGVFTLVSAILFVGVIAGLSFIMYGSEGYTAAVQWRVGWYSYPLSMGAVVLILIGITLLAAVLTGIFTMVISEGFHSSLIAMAVIIGGTFAVRLISIPRAYRLLSQIWNYFPINLTYFYEGFVDPRLVSFLGIRLTSWQFAPILYSVITVILVLFGKKLYCNYQVED